ncbi:MAG: ATP-dependent DNA helicase [Ruminococcus sp.]|nr:ATP-dependent DNA helicase [Ruminococcus sp.]
MEQQTIRISVRNLVEFILREGDIDNRTTGSMDLDSMQQGSRIHRKIQKRMGSEYRAEVMLKIQSQCDGFLLQVEGRADGIFPKEEIIYIDEIKGVARDIAYIEQPVSVHLAQAKCYAYIYALQNNHEHIGVQMTYCNLETEEIKRFQEEYRFEELELWFDNLVKGYEKWAKFQIEWRKVRNQSIRNTEFPFNYRNGQRELVSSVYRTILRKKKLFIQAPTGVGKTMATVFPAVRAVGEELGEKIFYMTAKTITRTVAEQAFHILRMQQKLQYKSITLTAKEKICFCEEKECNPDICPYAKGHFDRVNDAVFELITNEDEITRAVLEKQARKYKVCPFEMALDVSVWVDAVICDYNYVFDPTAHLKRFFSEGNKGEYLFLIDEAHNLVERGREMYSAQIYKEDVLSVKRVVKTMDSKLTKRLDECNKQLLELKRECENCQVLESVSHLALKFLNVLGELERFLEENREFSHRDEILDFYFQVRSFLNIYDILDDNYVIYSELEQDGRFKVKLFCVNPSTNLQKFLSQGNSTIFFSATLLPIHYYKELLSVEKEDYAIYAESTFPKENSCLLIGTDVSTKYTRREQKMYMRFAEYIKGFALTRQGNYMIFFPSYRFLEDVYECFEMITEGDARIESIIQGRYMNEEAREIFLESFEEERDCSLIGFCVMGGIFSEGIDLTDDRLIGAVIIGTGLPQVCNEREILKEWFENKMMSGFDFAYLYPGMNKVLQSAGRVIRTETDRGVILLLDERFLSRRYQETFPREWSEYQLCRLENMESKVNEFWRKE